MKTSKPLMPVPIRAGRSGSSQDKLAGRFLLDVFHHGLYAGQVSDKLVPTREGKGSFLIAQVLDARILYIRGNSEDRADLR